jgi:hypothetical protein
MKTFFRTVQTVSLLTALFLFAMCSKKEETQASNNESAQATTEQAPADTNRGIASAKFGDAAISINYGRPQLRGRDMLAQATDGMVWRMGMNEATEIKTGADLKFGETIIPIGSYSLWMKKISSGKWHLIFNKKTGIWGHAHPAAEDFAEVPMTMATNPQPVEKFTVEVTANNENAGTLKAMWGTAILSADFTVSAGKM